MTDLAQDGRNHRRVEASQRTSLTIAQGQDDEPGEDSSSTTSFVTCPEAEFTQRTSVQGTVEPDVSLRKDNILERAALAKSYETSAPFSKHKETRSSNEMSLKKRNVPPSTSGMDSPDQTRIKRVPWIPRRHIDITRRNFQSSSGSNTNTKDSSEPASLPGFVAPSTEAAINQSSSISVARSNPLGKALIAEVKTKAMKTNNELGHKNLGELYARFDKAHVEELQADLLEIEVSNSRSQNLATCTRNEAYDNEKKMQCRFCNLFFSPDQNVRDLDSGLSPCSHHPGKQHII